jgi:hypothetical protein
MKLKKYGITLERLTKADIELVRQYRNSAEIKKTMQFQEHITPQMQRKWFETINNENNYYFIIIYEGKKIGLINIKNFNCLNSLPESGLFIWDLNYISSPAPLLASILLCEFGYGILLGIETEVKILQSNTRALNYNMSLGYTEKYSMNNGFVMYRQTKESFLSGTSQIRKKALSLCNNDPHLYLYLEPNDKESGLAQKIFENIDVKIQNYEMRKENETEIYSFLLDFDHK